MKFDHYLNTWVYWPELEEELGENAFFPDGLVLNAGAGERQIDLPNASKVIGMDIQPSSNVDIVGNLESIPFASAYFDSIVCIAVLEHCRAPWEVVKEFSRVIKPHGKFLCVVPFMQPIHLYPGDYFRFTADGLKAILEENDFSIQKIAITHSIFHVFGWMMEDFLRSRAILWKLLLFPLAMLNYLLSKYMKVNVPTIPSVITVRAIKNN